MRFLNFLFAVRSNLEREAPILVSNVAGWERERLCDGALGINDEDKISDIHNINKGSHWGLYVRKLLQLARMFSVSVERDLLGRGCFQSSRCNPVYDITELDSSVSAGQGVLGILLEFLTKK